MSGELDLGTLSVKLEANTAAMEAGFAGVIAALKETQDQTSRLGNIMGGAFEGIGGLLEGAASKAKHLSRGFKEAFGDEAPAAMQAFGKEIESTLGLTDTQVKGLGESLKSLRGVFEIAAVSLSLLTPEIVAVGTGIAAVALAAVVLKVAFEQGTEKVQGLLYVLQAIPGIGSLVQIVIAAKDISASFGSAKGALIEFGDWAVKVAASIADSMSRAAQAMLSSFSAAFAFLEQHDPTGKLKDLGLSQSSQTVSNTIGGIRDSGAGGTAIQALWEETKKQAAGAAKDVTDAFQGIGTEFKNEGALVGAEIKKAVAWVLEQLKPGTSAADLKRQSEADWKELEAAVKFASETGKQVAKEMAEQEKAAAEERKTILKLMADQMSDELRLREEMEKDLKAQAEDYKKLMTEAMSAWKEKFSGLIQGTLFDMADAIKEHATLGIVELSNAFKNATNILTEALISGSKYLGTIVKGAVSGFESGGVWGALIGAIAGAVTMSTEFAEILKDIDLILGPVIEVFGKLLAGVVGSIQGLMGFLGPLCTIIGDIFDILNIAMIPLTIVTDMCGELGQALQVFADWLSTAVASLKTFVSGAFDSLAVLLKLKSPDPQSSGDTPAKTLTPQQAEAYWEAVGIIGRHATDLGKLENATIDATISLRELSDPELLAASKDAFMAQLDLQTKQNALNAEWTAEYDALHGITDATQKATQSLTQFSDAVLNAAPGYKLALNEFNSEGAAGGNGNHTDSIQVNVYLDSKDIAAQVEKRQLRQSFVNTSSPFRRGPAKVGGF